MRICLYSGALRSAIWGATSDDRLALPEHNPLLQVESPCSRDACQRHKLSNLLHAVSTACATAVPSMASDSTPTNRFRPWRHSVVRSPDRSPHQLDFPSALPLGRERSRSPLPDPSAAGSCASGVGGRTRKVCRTRLDKRGRSSSPRTGRAKAPNS